MTIHIGISGWRYAGCRGVGYRSAWRRRANWVTRRAPRVTRRAPKLFASGVLAHEDTLGPCLRQFPPNFPFDATRLERFPALLPQTIEEAIGLAREHDAPVKTPWFGTKRRRMSRLAAAVPKTT
ncbi:hypothetical protein AB1286_24660 [Trinickia sp. NRRL B-1857]|uniref:hypothetical protein n=1 Tax=Trinickia sp. NRRL B-1857 TaxID=3162879 RepID=UPI003D280958